MSRSAALKTYWRQVREVQRQSGVSSADARRATKILRDEYGVKSAHQTKGVTREGLTMVKESVSKAKSPYSSLQDYIDAWEGWDGDVYPDYDVETGVDY